MRRTLLLGAAWLASAGAAVGLGFLAVSLVGASASPVTSPAAATSTSATSIPASPTGAGPAVPTATGEFGTIGGTVYANCTTGSPVLAGVPVAGWWVDNSDDPGEVEFKNGSQKVEVHVTCADGSPRFFQEGPRADDGHREDSSTSPSSPTSGRDDDRHDDDSSGHGSGHDDDDDDSSGHGSDDGPGDDSSGRGGGGHGSDD